VLLEHLEGQQPLVRSALKISGGSMQAPGRCDSERDRPARVVALWVPQRSGQGVPLRGARREHGVLHFIDLRSVGRRRRAACVDFMLPLLQGCNCRWMRRR